MNCKLQLTMKIFSKSPHEVLVIEELEFYLRNYVPLSSLAHQHFIVHFVACSEQNCFYELLRQSSYFKINWPCCRNLLSVKLKGREQGWATEMHYWLDYTCLVHGMLDLKALWHNNISSIYTYYYQVQSWIPRIHLRMCK